MTDSEDPDQTSLIRIFTVLSVLSVLILRGMVFNNLNIMHNIQREKFFDMVSEG